MGHDTRKGSTETYGDAARRLLAKMNERKKFTEQHQPRSLVLAGKRGLGLSEEKNRRQLPRTVANDNDGVRQGLDRVLRGGEALVFPQPLPDADEREAPIDHAAQATFSAFEK